MGTGKRFKCDLCEHIVSGYYIHQHTFICHEKLHFGHGLYTPSSTVKCSTCGENQTASEYTLHLHQHRFDSYGLVKPLLKCRLCDIFLMTEIQREQHEKIHTLTTETIKDLTDPYKCRYCDKQIDIKYNTQQHETACALNPYNGKPTQLKRNSTDDKDGVKPRTRKKVLRRRSNGSPKSEKPPSKYQPGCHSDTNKVKPTPLKRKSTDNTDWVAPCTPKKGFAPPPASPQRSTFNSMTEIPPSDCKWKIKRTDRRGNKLTCFRDAKNKMSYKCDLCGDTKVECNFHHHSYLCHQKVMFGNCSIQPTSMVTCTFCDSPVLASKYALHVQRHRWLLYQAPPQLRCAKCKLTFWSKGNLDCHNKTHYLNKSSVKKMDNPFQCKRCEKIFPEIRVKIIHKKYCERGYKKRRRYNKAIKPIRKIFAPESLPDPNHSTTEDIPRNQEIEDLEKEAVQKVSTFYRINFYPCGNCDFLSTNKTVGPQKMIKHCTLFHGVTFKKVKQSQVTTTRDSTKKYRCYVCGHLFYSAAFARCHVEYCEIVNGLTTANTGALKNIPMLKHV